MKTLLEIVLMPLVAYLALSSLYQLVLAFAANTKDSQPKKSVHQYSKFLVLVPAYKENDVILNSVEKNLQARYEYPREQFDLMVIADQLESSTTQKIKSLGALVHQVKFDKSTKVKSLQSAINATSRKYDAVVVLDADNTMEKGFLFKANQWLLAGNKAIQGIRKAANSNTTTALLDGLSETANTELLCKGANRLGFSSKLSGSAMIFDFELFKNTINQCSAIGGFDKEMELILTKHQGKIVYAEDIAVLDQKVSTPEAFSNQRGRWLEAQYSFFKKSFKGGISELLKGNTDHFHKVMQLALPPRALSPFALCLLILSSWLIGLQITNIVTVVSLIMLMLSYLLVLPIRALFKQSVKILLGIPQIGLAAFKALFIIQRSKVEFIHTPHQLIKS